ncbi:unnamed protein product, partial [Owenia fusiformis]
MSIPTVKLSNGAEMPMLGLGTWKSKAGEVENAVGVAIETGYRHIDCAYCYGNENEVGAGIKKKVDDGTVKREDLFIVSKLWNAFHRPDLVRGAVDESLKSLGVKYLDLYLIHWPYGFKEGLGNLPKDEAGNVLYSDVNYLDTWKVLEELVDEGILKAIGLSNFNSVQIQDVIDNSRIKPTNLQVECHPYHNQAKLLAFCLERNITFTAYSPFASPDRPWAKPGEPLLIDDPRLKAIAEKYSKTPAQVVLRYQVQRQVVVIPKSVTPARIQSNFQIFDFELSA